MSQRSQTRSWRALEKSQCPQLTLFKVITMYSQCGSILPQTLRELINYMFGYIVIAFLDISWKKSQRVAHIYGDYIVNKIVKETLDSFQKVATCYFGVFFVKVISMYPLFTLWSKWWIHLKKTQHISTGFWLDKLLKKSQLNHNVSTDYISPCPQRGQL